MSHRPSVKAILAEHRLAPSKRRGQNFLIGTSTAEQIVAATGFTAHDRVIEVGVGLGALTIPLAQTAAEVVGIEVDRGLIAYHERERILPENVHLLHGDVLRIDWRTLVAPGTGRLKLIANLPYSISSPFLFKMIDNRHLVDQAVIMLQKEVADRLAAAPGTKAYGIPTVLLGCCARVEALLAVPADCFHPKPTIDSRVIRITFATPLPDNATFAIIQQVVRAAFASRRKTLLNNLLASSLWRNFDTSDPGASTRRREKLLAAIADIGLPPSIRGELLTIDQFKDLAAALFRRFP